MNDLLDIAETAPAAPAAFKQPSPWPIVTAENPGCVISRYIDLETRSQVFLADKGYKGFGPRPGSTHYHPPVDDKTPAEIAAIEAEFDRLWFEARK